MDVRKNLLASDEVSELARLMEEILSDQKKVNQETARKAARAGWTQGRVDADAPARERTLAMIFEKNSTRTRFSFDAAMRQLGGDVIISTAADMQLGRGETIADTARVLSRMVDAVMLRSNRHTDLEDLAAHCAVPVINGLSDTGHPCQILADLMTFEAHRGPVAGRTLAWVGDGNNVCASVIHAAPPSASCRLPARRQPGLQAPRLTPNSRMPPDAYAQLADERQHE
jgi:ornithine carbamoyltransferase